MTVDVSKLMRLLLTQESGETAFAESDVRRFSELLSGVPPVLAKADVQPVVLPGSMPTPASISKLLPDSPSPSGEARQQSFQLAQLEPIEPVSQSIGPDTGGNLVKPNLSAEANMNPAEEISLPPSSRSFSDGRSALLAPRMLEDFSKAVAGAGKTLSEQLKGMAVSLGASPSGAPSGRLAAGVKGSLLSEGGGISRGALSVVQKGVGVFGVFLAVLSKAASRVQQVFDQLLRLQ